jgi:predicted regulator of Ras-like GTPase activity (Roadblock/LC7/MglB family)
MTEAHMDAALAQLNEAVPGVIGSMAVDASGRLLGRAFALGAEPPRLQEVATLVADRSAAMEEALGPLGTLDLRFANVRLVVKSTPAARLLLVCAPTVNLSLLSMSAAGPLRRLAQAQAQAPAQAKAPVEPVAAPRPQGAGELLRIVQRIDERLLGSGPDRFKLRGQIAMKAGFSLDLVDADTPDDPERLQRLKAAATAVLGRI